MSTSLRFSELKINNRELKNNVLLCSACESLQQIKHLRWVKSYLPGIKLAICHYCYNFRFSPVKQIPDVFVIYHHESGSIFTSKLDTAVRTKVPEEDLEIFQ